MDKEYNEAIAEADQFVLGRDYDAAKEKFNEALNEERKEEFNKAKLDKDDVMELIQQAFDTQAEN